MKPKITPKGLLISLAAIILAVGIFNYAAGDITFPNIFHNGTVADADQVNANFAAINSRQAASVARLAGTYDYRGSGIVVENVNGVSTLCPVSFRGIAVLTSNGSGTLSETDNDQCQGSVSGTGNITVAVNPNGSGTLTTGSGVVNSIQVSKDLNTIVVSSTTSGSYTSSIAVRR